MTVPEIRSPLRTEPARWNFEADVVVLGLGGAGAAAAVQAAEAGADVLAIDRFIGGGDTAMSGGVVYAGGGTRAQSEAGRDDSAENMFNYLREEFEGAISDTTLRRFCDESIEMLEWLERHGVQFGDGFWEPKTAFPPNGYHLYYSGSEETGPFDAKATPAPRGHKVAGTKMSTGAKLYAPLADAAQAAGARIQKQTRGIRLITNAQNAVLGVECAIFPSRAAARAHAALAHLVLRTTPWVSVGPVFPSYYWALRNLESRFQTGRIQVRARRGLIISTGGFSWNPNMMREYAPDISKTMPIGFDANGSGILLGQTVGAATDHLENVGTFRMFVPPLAFGRGMLVDAKGQRSANELWYTGRIGGAMRQRTNGRGYLILDQELVEQAKTEIPDLAPFLGLPARLWLTRAANAPTLSALAAKLGMPDGSLDASAERIAAIAQGASDPYGRAAKDTHPLTRGPFYALDMSLNAQPLPATRLSLGGLVVDENTGAVLDQYGQPIRGLYAAGRAAVGLCSRSYISGTALADAVFSGRRAGATAATANA